MSDQKAPIVTLSAYIENACTECGHQFVDGDEVHISAIFIFRDGKLVLNDHAPEVICFPGNDDGHYAGK